MTRKYPQGIGRNSIVDISNGGIVLPRVKSDNVTNQVPSSIWLNNESLQFITEQGAEISVRGTVEDLIIDDFDDNEFQEWKNGGNVSTEVGFDGSTAIRVESLNDDPVTTIPGDGLNYYPVKGDVISGFINGVESAGFGEFCWALQERQINAEGFQLRFDPTSDVVRINEVNSNGNTTNLTSSSVTLNNNKWYKFYIEWGNSDIVVTITDPTDNSLVTELVARPSINVDSGGIGITGFRGDNNASAGLAIDELKVVDRV